jgi:hypothetical protein
LGFSRWMSTLFTTVPPAAVFERISSIAAAREAKA